VAWIGRLNKTEVKKHCKQKQGSKGWSGEKDACYLYHPKQPNQARAGQHAKAIKRKILREH